jgi:hypothetical protein
MEEYLLKAVFETPMTGDGALAIMTCMATNLNCLRIDLARSSPLPVIQSMLSPLGWSDHSDGKAYPFHRLKSLYLGSSPGDETYCNVAIHPKCSELIVSGITFVEKLSWSKYDNSNQLRRMILECIHVDPEMLEYIFATAAFPNLQVINASDIGCRYLSDTPDNAEMYD